MDCEKNAVEFSELWSVWKNFSAVNYEASLANAFGAFFFGVPNYCNTLILTDIHGHTQLFVVDGEITYKYYITLFYTLSVACSSGLVNQTDKNIASII